jgi:hypothetical protein
MTKGEALPDMPQFNPKARMTSRGQHPDVTEDGYLVPEAFTYADPQERDFNRQFSRDPNFAAGYMEKVADYQRGLPAWIQESVAGATFGDGQGTYQGVVEYRRELERLRQIEDQFTYGEGVTVVRDHEIADMSLERYDELFDSNARPKPGVVLEHSNRSVRLDSGIDPHSARELGNR